MRMLGGRKGNLRDRRGQGTTERQSMAEAYGPVVGGHTVFFFAKSPEAPRTTITVLFLSSMALQTVSGQRKIHCLGISRVSSCRSDTQYAPPVERGGAAKLGRAGLFADIKVMEGRL